MALVTDINLNEHGRVMGVNHRINSLGNARISECMTRQMKRIRFPRPAEVKSKSFTVSMSFRVSGGAMGQTTPREEIAALERKKDLSPHEKGSLLSLYAQTKNRRKFNRLARSWREQSKNGDCIRTFGLFSVILSQQLGLRTYLSKRQKRF